MLNAGFDAKNERGILLNLCNFVRHRTVELRYKEKGLK